MAHRLGAVPGHGDPPLLSRSLLPGSALVAVRRPEIPGHLASPVVQSSLLPGGAVGVRGHSAIPGHVAAPSSPNPATSRSRCRAASSRCRPRSWQSSRAFRRSTSRWRCRAASCRCCPRSSHCSFFARSAVTSRSRSRGGSSRGNPRSFRRSVSRCRRCYFQVALSSVERTRPSQVISALLSCRRRHLRTLVRGSVSPRSSFGSFLKIRVIVSVHTRSHEPSGPPRAS